MKHIQALAVVHTHQHQKSAGRGETILKAMATQPVIGKALLNVKSMGRWGQSYGATPGGADLLAQTLKTRANPGQRSMLTRSLLTARRMRRVPAPLNPMAEPPKTLVPTPPTNPLGE